MHSGPGTIPIKREGRALRLCQSVPVRRLQWYYNGPRDRPQEHSEEEILNDFSNGFLIS